MDKKKDYFLRGEREVAPVDKDIYVEFYKMRRREKHLEESDLLHGKISYNDLDTEDYNGEEILADTYVDIEEVVIARIMIQKLRKCLVLLSGEERELLHEIYVNNKSERALSRESNIPQKTINYRKTRILHKLHQMMENK